MKKYTTAIAGGAMLLLAFNACKKIDASGPPVTEQRSISAFTKIKHDCAATVLYTIDTALKLEVQAPQDIMSHVRTYVLGNELIVDFKGILNIINGNKVVVKVSAPAPEYVALNGSGDMNISGNMVRPWCNFRVNGSGSITAAQVTLGGELTATVNGSGNIRIQSGTAQNTYLRIIGSGDVDAANVPAPDARTETSGSGSIRLYATQKLQSSISGSGSVYYRGNPVVSASISGSGKVKPL